MSFPAADFQIRPCDGVSNEFVKRGVATFHEALTYIGRLPYGRNTDRADFRLVLPEQKGTCATKHALLAQLALEQQRTDIRLVVGVYEMHERNTPGVGQVLEQHGLTYVPEAHCYLMSGEERIDVTRAGVTGDPITHFLFEQEITPEGIGALKTELHQEFIKRWLTEQGESRTFGELWAIREACIKALSS